MPGRSYTGSGYRHGFNGQEKDDEISGVSGTHTTAEFWEYDTRTGRRWNTDPIIKPWESPYMCFSGNPLYFQDINGDNGEPTGDKKSNPNGNSDGKPHEGDMCNNPDGTGETYIGGEWRKSNLAGTQEVAEVSIIAPRRNSDPEYKEAVDKLGQAGLAQLKESIYQAKIFSVNTPLHRGIWGQNGDGSVFVPEVFKKKFRAEAEEEAMPAFKVAWAMQQSGVELSSFNYLVNPLALAAYLRARARAVTTKDEAWSFVGGIALEVAAAYILHMNLTGQSINFRRYPNAGGAGVNFNIGGKRSIGFDYHRIGKSRVYRPHVDINNVKTGKKIVDHWPFTKTR